MSPGRLQVKSSNQGPQMRIEYARAATQDQDYTIQIAVLNVRDAKEY